MNFASLFRRRPRAAAVICLLCNIRTAVSAAALTGDSGGTAVEEMPPLTVTGDRAPTGFLALPGTVQSVTSAQMNDTVNAVDAEDALKYLPGLFLRKRNDGDTQAVLATRTWGLNSSARSLVYADGVLLSALIANNNTLGAPRWGMVAPAAIERVDVLYGPYSAAFPGNSMGAVVQITTRMPEKFEASLDQTETLQSFSLYGTKNSYLMSQTALTAGDREGKWSFWITANGQDSHDQPLTFVTAAAVPTGTTGGIVAWNKLGQPADVLGANGVQHSEIGSATLKAAYDFTPQVRAAYTLGHWRNTTDSTVQTYLRDAAGQPTFAGQSGFATGTYHLNEQHVAQSLTLGSNQSEHWDWQAVGSLYDFAQDTQRSPSTAAATGTALSPAGKVALLGGTGWSTVDLTAAWRPQGRSGFQKVSWGVHQDEYSLVNPTYNTPDWTSGRTTTSLATEGNGKTRTQAVWLQDRWQLASALRLTVGGRFEHWKAFDGVNANGATTVLQPVEVSTDFSPKGTLAWTVATGWTLIAEVGAATRYPTAGELYQLVSTGTVFTSPNPDLNPEKVWSKELKLEHQFGSGLYRLSLFQEDVSQALVSQYAALLAGSSTPYQYVMNLGRLRNRGVELFADQEDVLIRHLELSGSVTYVDSRILEDSDQGQFTTAVGKHAPYVPDWRATMLATYRPRPNLAWTVAGRYSGKQYSTVDNVDTNPDTYGGFQDFFVLDAHVHWTLASHWTIAGGIDNALNRKYFLFHPFPQRTWVTEVKCGF